jgi:hypothetical protein
VTAQRSDHAEAIPEDVRRARMLPEIDRAQRIAAMLSRWEAEDVSGEQHWDVAGVEPMTLRSRSSRS